MSVIENLEKMLSEGRDDALIRFGLGNAYLQQKAFDQALPHLERAVEHDPDYSAAWKALGKVRTEVGDANGAAAAYKEGIRIAEAKGDIQAAKEMTVFLKRLEKQQA